MKTKSIKTFVHRLLVTALICGTGIMASCIKDEEPNKECDIESAWIDQQQYGAYFYHPADMMAENISSTNTDIDFTVRSLLSIPRQIAVNFKLTAGATISPESGSLQDFTQGPVVYTVTSEDGLYQRKYQVSLKEAALPFYKFSFEHARVIDAGNNGKRAYHEFFEIGNQGNELNIWASGNSGAILTKMVDVAPEDMPTYSTPLGYQGKGVCMNTQSAGMLGEAMKKPIAAGNLFLGKFLIENVLLDPLKTTQFGIAIEKTPIRVSGWYKYKPGPVFTNADMETLANRTDEADIYGVFFHNKTSDGKEYFLYGDDVDTDEKLKSNPQVLLTARVASLPPTDEWRRFEMFFEGREVDARLVADRGCSLAIVFSSSKDGAKFEGAIGSTLYVDEVEVSFNE